MDTQLFSDSVGVVETRAPQQLGGDAGDAANAISGALGTATRLLQDNRAGKAAEAAAQATGSVAQAFVESEGFKRREPLQEAVAAGYLTQEQAANFGADEADSLAALNQASAQGLGTSIRNALERSVKFQFSAMKNPGAAKELAAAYGIGDNGVAADTLTAIEEIERKQLEEDADAVRAMAKEEGYSDFLNKSNEEVLDLWIGSPAEQREREIRQNKRSALAQEASISERAPSASRAMGLELSSINKQLNNVVQSYYAAQGNSNAGTDGTQMSLSEQLALVAEERIGDIARTYADFPKLVETFTTGIRNNVASIVDSKKKGIEQFNLEVGAQIEKPMELERLEQDVIYKKFQNSQNSVRALQTTFNYHTSIAKENTRIAKELDEIVNNPGKLSPNIKALLDDPVSRQKQAILLADAQEGGNQLFLNLVDPEKGNIRQAADEAATATILLAREGVASNEATLKRVTGAIQRAYENDVELSPSKARAVEQSVLKLAEDERFVETVSNSPAFRGIVKPYSEGIKQEIVSSLQKTIDGLATDRVNTFGNGNLPGSTETRFSAWRKLGQYTILDTEATNQVGVPQYKLVNNLSEALTDDDIGDLGQALQYWNRKGQQTSNPSHYKLLKNLTGAPSIAGAVTNVIESSEGVALESLSPTRAIPDRTPEQAARKREVATDPRGGGLTR